MEDGWSVGADNPIFDTNHNPSRGRVKREVEVVPDLRVFIYKLGFINRIFQEMGLVNFDFRHLSRVEKGKGNCLCACVWRWFWFPMTYFMTIYSAVVLVFVSLEYPGSPQESNERKVLLAYIICMTIGIWVGVFFSLMSALHIAHDVLLNDNVFYKAAYIRTVYSFVTHFPLQIAFFIFVNKPGVIALTLMVFQLFLELCMVLNYIGIQTIVKELEKKQYKVAKMLYESNGKWFGIEYELFEPGSNTGPAGGVAVLSPDEPVMAASAMASAPVEAEFAKAEAVVAEAV